MVDCFLSGIYKYQHKIKTAAPGKQLIERKVIKKLITGMAFVCGLGIASVQAFDCANPDKEGSGIFWAFWGAGESCASSGNLSQKDCEDAAKACNWGGMELYECATGCAIALTECSDDTLKTPR